MKPTHWILLTTVSVLLGTLPLTAAAGEPRPADLRERAEQIEREARELKEQGRHDQAGRRQREAEELRQHARNRDGDHPPERGDRSARPRQEGRQPGGPGDPQPEAMRERMEHARMAIHHLHSAGLPDLAEQLERQIAERVLHIRQRRASAGPRPAASREQSELLLRQMEEMRRALREMNRRLEGLEQDLR